MHLATNVADGDHRSLQEIDGPFGLFIDEPLIGCRPLVDHNARRSGRSGNLLPDLFRNERHKRMEKFKRLPQNVDGYTRG